MRAPAPQVVPRPKSRLSVQERVAALRRMHREHPELSYPWLGLIFGIHHSTVCYWLGGRERRPLKDRGRYGVPPFVPDEETPF